MIGNIPQDLKVEQSRRKMSGQHSLGLTNAKITPGSVLYSSKIMSQQQNFNTLYLNLLTIYVFYMFFQIRFPIECVQSSDLPDSVGVGLMAASISLSFS